MDSARTITQCMIMDSDDEKRPTREEFEPSMSWVAAYRCAANLYVGEA